MRIIVVLLVIICVFLFAGLVQDEPGKWTALQDGNRIALRVNGQEVTRAEFQKMLLEYKERSFLEELVDHLLLEQAAAKAGISISDEKIRKQAIDAMMDELADCGNDVGEFKEALALYGSTVEEREKALVKETKWELLAEELVKKERTSEANMKALFEKRFPGTAGRIAKVYHILISADEMRRQLTTRLGYLERRSKIASADEKKDVISEIARLKKKMEAWKDRNSKEAADEAVKKLRSGGDFAAVAAEFGAGYTAEKYDMGWVTRQWVFKLLAPIIFDQLKAGEIAEPVQSRYGFHVVKLIDVKDVSELKYKEVRPYLQDELMTTVANHHEIVGLKAKLRKEASIERPLLQAAERDESGK